MRKLFVALGASVALGLFASPANATHQHLHCVTPPSGNQHSVGRGVTLNAPEHAFTNFHTLVHEGAFANTQFAIAVDTTAVPAFTCPPS